MSNNETLKNIGKLIAKLKDITGVSFVSTKYTNADGEVQLYTINVGVSYENAVKKDIEFLKTLDVKTMDCGVPHELLEEARVALLEAKIKPDKAKSDAQKNAYTHLTNGLKIHNTTSELYVYGMKVKKTVLVEGDYKEDTRRPLTVAKDKIREQLKSDGYRQFKIENAEVFRLKGDTLVFGEVE